MHDTMVSQLHAAYLAGDLAAVEALLGPTRDMLTAALDEVMGPVSVSGVYCPACTDDTTVTGLVAA